MEIKIIYEDQDFLIIEKPSGIVVNRSQTASKNTIQDWMEEKFSIFNFQFSNKEEKEFVNRSGVVHRLDKETSGLMVLAKNSSSFQYLKLQFKNRQTKKKYIALVHGKVEPKQGSINLPLKRNPLNRKHFTVKIDGKMAKTEYKVLQYYFKDKQDFTLLSINLKTGRTHQIRVHLSFLGYSLVSDPIYLGKRLKNDLLWCPRLFLHAASLGFFKPNSNQFVKFESKLCNDLQSAIKTNFQ